MVGKTELYDVFGEMIYVIAKSDGHIQDEEIQAFEKKIEGHPWAQAIKWSFDYESKHDRSPEELYKKVVSICEELGPNPEYVFLIEVMEEVAAASKGIDQEERAKMNNFSSDLLKKFRKDIQRIEDLD